MTKLRKKLWIGFFILALLTLVVVNLSGEFNAGGTRGNWGPKTLEKLLGYAPEGLRKLPDLPKPPIPHYNLTSENANLTLFAISYTLSGLLELRAVSLAIMQSQA